MLAVNFVVSAIVFPFWVIRAIPGYLRVVALAWWNVIAPPLPAFRGLGDRLISALGAGLLSTPLFIASALIGNFVGANVAATGLVILTAALWVIGIVFFAAICVIAANLDLTDPYASVY